MKNINICIDTWYTIYPELSRISALIYIAMSVKPRQREVKDKDIKWRMRDYATKKNNKIKPVIRLSKVKLQCYRSQRIVAHLTIKISNCLPFSSGAPFLKIIKPLIPGTFPGHSSIGARDRQANSSFWRSSAFAALFFSVQKEFLYSHFWEAVDVYRRGGHAL